MKILLKLLAFIAIITFVNVLLAEDSSKSIHKNLDVNTESRNVVAFGYQIGGYSIIGVDYEIRASDYIGIHFGGGFAGGTAGIKFHFSPDKDSSFLNLSVKDGGFGLIEVIAFEYGGRWVFSDSSGLGLHYQIGAAYILHIDSEMRDKVFDGKDIDVFFPSLGVGLSF